MLFLRLIGRYFEHLKKTKFYLFIFELFICQLLLNELILSIAHLFLNFQSENTGVLSSDINNINILSAVDKVIIAPILETILLQFIPIQIASTFGTHIFYQWLLSSLFFSALHATFSGVRYFFGVLGSGCILSLAFLLKRDKSLWTSILATTILHALMNFLVLLNYTVL